MNIPSNIITGLICLYCQKSSIFVDDARQSLSCQNCGHTYPVVDNIPIMIRDDLSVFSTDDFLERHCTFFDLSKDGQRISQIGKIIPAMETHWPSKHNFNLLVELLGQLDAPRVLLLGASIEGNYSSVLVHNKSISVVESDVSFGSRTDIILDAHAIPYSENSFDCVVVQAVLEHVIDPHQCVSEIYRILKPTGFVYAETPFMQQVHGGAFDFTRFSKSGHRWLFRKFSEVDSGATSGPGSAMAWAYQYLLLSLFGYTPRSRLIVKALARLTGFWLKYFDLFSTNNPYKTDAACGIYFLGRKSDNHLSEKDIVQYYEANLRRDK